MLLVTGNHRLIHQLVEARIALAEEVEPAGGRLVAYLSQPPERREFMRVRVAAQSAKRRGRVV
jgi:hypothetical protein